jgi:serine/threonine-protein kinase mTOR
MTTRYRVQHKNYDTLVSKLLKGEPLPQELGKGVDGIRGFEMQSADPQPAQKLGVNNRSLKRAWDASQRSTTEDWLKWIRGLNNELLKESPSHALRACTMLAANYPPLARELFNTAFATCYADLYDQNQVCVMLIGPS